MITCAICITQFSNNFGGQLTNHLKEIHNLSLRDYMIKIDYNGIPPQCECGLCDEIPVFSRGKFLRYALNHNKFKVRENLYIQKYGEPTCQECHKKVKFSRGKPKKYCSNKCSGKNLGFSLLLTQEKIKKTVKEKYGVTNVSKLDSIKLKISASNLGKKWKMNEAGKQKISDGIKSKWKNNVWKNKTSISIKASFSKNNQSKKLFSFSKNRLTKLHKRIKEKLELEKLGFISEQQISKYFVDELNEERKTIIEINGDYCHANPLLHRENDIIRLYGQTYTAHEKWESDSLRKKKLEELGYCVIVVWESDDLEKKKIEIMKALNDEKE
jgi:very-short-patch-repair endonuclease/ribosomal protein L37AE/L43A